MKSDRSRYIAAYLMTGILLGFGVSGSATLALRWVTEGWSPVFAVLLPLDVGALIVGTTLTVQRWRRTTRPGGDT